MFCINGISLGVSVTTGQAYLQTEQTEQAYFSLSSLVLGPDLANLKITFTLL